MAGKVERKNVSPVAEGKKVKSQARSRGEHGVGLVRRWAEPRASGPNGSGH